MKLISAFLIGGLFGMGIIIAGMGNPAKIMNFFDVFGTFDPSLIFVMGGGLITTMIGYRLVFGARAAPVLERAYDIPAKRTIDAPLVVGSLTFGIGWGITGFCPGGAIPALGLGDASVPVFIAAMIAGIVLARMVQGGTATLQTA
jgi:uncharacterized protein